MINLNSLDFLSKNIKLRNVELNVLPLDKESVKLSYNLEEKKPFYASNNI
jgi:hypothetical protein